MMLNGPRVLFNMVKILELASVFLGLSCTDALIYAPPSTNYLETSSYGGM